jgi:hypothetical protein
MRNSTPDLRVRCLGAHRVEVATRRLGDRPELTFSSVVIPALTLLWVLPSVHYLLMRVDEVARSTESLVGVRHYERRGLQEWRYHGRLVWRQLDDEQIVIRADFGYREALLQRQPNTFSVPNRFAKHMMVVANLPGGDARAIEDAIEAAWQLQRRAD